MMKKINDFFTQLQPGTGEHTFPGQLAAQGCSEPAAASVTLAELKQTEKDLERQRAAGSGSQRAGEHNVVMHDYISQYTVPVCDWQLDRKTHLYALVYSSSLRTGAIYASAKWVLYFPPNNANAFSWSSYLMTKRLWLLSA